MDLQRKYSDLMVKVDEFLDELERDTHQLSGAVSETNDDSDCDVSEPPRYFKCQLCQQLTDSDYLNYCQSCSGYECGDCIGYIHLKNYHCSSC